MINIEVSHYVYPLEKLGRMGHVHSVFNSSFNFLINHQLVHVSSHEDFMSSFGIRISKLDYQLIRPYLQVGNLVKLTADTLMIYSFNGIYQTSYKEIVTDLRIDKIDFTKQFDKKLNALKNYLEHKSHLSVKNGLGDGAQKALTTLTDVKASLLELDQSVKQLIGRGQGLTPSGDDILVTYLFMMIICHDNQRKRVSSCIENYLDKTTLISTSYLKACLNQAVSTPLYDLYLWLKNHHHCEKNKLERCVSNIQRIGHTSGSDMLLGLFLGISFVLQTHSRSLK
ncbi:DUF2877 domain-containing protein [Streptococcus sp. CSL10205-OR2]|uniref:DUF2877 domain-containing protein n=1 Tax=Streptococcus sp. CSL10205-OR2 TaxID=2980558 RepID=UPI0021DAE308|nr:DUF2877 domain-containing protein [Streptococcus sp. CSL10205-OR2]MCU9533925.1 DUF2877 domain-containing protein [Streptococcus sp. CSL10205-OR2]